MSAVCILTPIVISSWPAISAAVCGAAAALGFSIRSEQLHQERLPPQSRRRGVETAVPHSEILVDQLVPAQTLTIERDDVRVEIGRDERGACRVCVTGPQSDAELRRIGQQVAGRIVQQFAYHKLMAELKKRSACVLEERVLADDSVQVRIRL